MKLIHCILTLKNRTVLRLHGFNRKEIELKTNKIWNKVVHPQDTDIQKIVELIKSLLDKKVDVYLNVYNHFEGSAPLTSKKKLIIK